MINTIEKSLLVREDLALQYDILSCCNLLLVNHMSDMSGDDKINTILIGIKNTNRALAINSDSQYYWHHLGIFYWHLYQATGEKRNQLKSIQALLNSIKLNPRNANVWNTLGVIAGDHLSVSQHCLLNSIKLCAATTEMQWSNLGVVYMKDAALCVNLEDDLIFRAHKCFNESQAQNPNYVNCWIGQALIAENVNHSSTLDLLRHCNSLKYHPIPTVCFAYHLLLDTNPNQPDLFNLAIDHMRIYTQKKANDPLALNLLGCLYERQGYRRTAYELFERALQHSQVTATEYAKNHILINYLRNAAYRKRANELRLMIDEQLYKTEWQPAVYLCLANLRDGQYEEAGACLEHALELVDPGSYLCFLINALQYLLAERAGRPADVRFSTEMIQANEPLRTVFIVQLMLSRSYSPALKALIDVILIQPNLIDMLLISTFAQEQLVNFAQDFQGLPQTWIKQALDYLISPTQNAKDDLKEFNRIYRNFISCKQIKPKQLVGYHILLALNLVESESDECLRKCLVNMQTAYYLMPFDSTIRRLFEIVHRITAKQLACQSLLEELRKNRAQFLVFVLEFLQ